MLELYKSIRGIITSELILISTSLHAGKPRNINVLVCLCSHSYFFCAAIQVDQKLARMDEILSRLEVGLRKASLTDKVNVIVVADHGMVSAGPDKVIQLMDYVPNINKLAYAYDGAFGRINFKDTVDNGEF